MDPTDKRAVYLKRMGYQLEGDKRVSDRGGSSSKA
jgi:hypothetical protein